MKPCPSHDDSPVRISVLMPSYNPGDYFQEAVESALAAMGPTDELVVQDACSTDGAAEYIDQVATKDSRVKVCHEKDNGQSDALNRALNRSRGDFIVWLNADDIIHVEALESIRRVLLLQHHVDVIQGMHSVLRADGSVIASYDPPLLSTTGLMIRGCYVFSGSLAVRRAVLEEVGGFARDLSFCMDLDLMFRLCNKPDIRLAKMPRPMGALRWHDASKSGGQGHRFVLEGQLVRRRYIRHLGDIARSLSAAILQTVALATTGIRHTNFYSALRRRKV